jgi:hypothetical protein
MKAVRAVPMNQYAMLVYTVKHVTTDVVAMLPNEDFLALLCQTSCNNASTESCPNNQHVERLAKYFAPVD